MSTLFTDYTNRIYTEVPGAIQTDKEREVIIVNTLHIGHVECMDSETVTAAFCTQVHEVPERKVNLLATTNAS